MSFDIFYCPVKIVIAEHVQAESGPTASELAKRTLTPEEVDSVMAVINVIRTRNAENKTDFVRFGDGGELELGVGNIREGGCMVSLHGSSWTPDCMQFLWDLLGATSWMMFPVADAPVVITKQAVQPDVLLSGHRVVTCRSGDHLAEILRPPFSVWKEFRDQIASEKVE